jgi:exosortase
LRPGFTPGGIRSPCFLIFWVCSTILFRDPLSTLARLALHDERYSYVLLIPIVSLGLMIAMREGIFAQPRLSVPAGATAAILGFAAFLSTAQGLFVRILLILLMWIAMFTFFYGRRAAKAAIFPLAFLFLMVPIPGFVLDRIVWGLQRGTAEISSVLFRLTGIPAFREGLRFALPGIDIEIAEECSGVRSSLSFLVASILSGYLVLGSIRHRILLILLCLPVVVFKNAVRVVGIAWLGVRVNRSFLFGNLHHYYGGLVFSLLGIAILGGLLFALKRREDQDSDGKPNLPARRFRSDRLDLRLFEESRS